MQLGKKEPAGQAGGAVFFPFVELSGERNDKGSVEGNGSLHFVSTKLGTVSGRDQDARALHAIVVDVDRTHGNEVVLGGFVCAEQAARTPR